MIGADLVRESPHTVGRDSTLRDEILLAELLYDVLAAREEIEPFSQVLATATVRFVPVDLRSRRGDEQVEAYLDRLNARLATQMVAGRTRYVWHSEVSGHAVLKICAAAVLFLLQNPKWLVRRLIGQGRAMDRQLRSAAKL